MQSEQKTNKELDYNEYDFWWKKFHWGVEKMVAGCFGAKDEIG